jgi:S1-C subfamily serine protease
MRILGVLVVLLLAACDSPAPPPGGRLAAAASYPPSVSPTALAAVSQVLGVAVRNGVGGVMIIGIDLDGPAAAAGARVGDFIVSINGESVGSEADLVSLVASANSSTVAVNLWRQGEKQQVAMALHAPQPAPAPDAAAPKSAAGALGLEVRQLPLAQAKSIGLEFGLMVTRVRAPADRSRILPGDVILAVNQTPVGSLEQFEELLAAQSDAASVGLVVRRAEKDLYIGLDRNDRSLRARRPATDTPLRT